MAVVDKLLQTEVGGMFLLSYLVGMVLEGMLLDSEGM
jgi:hypothetical protein